MMDRLFGSSAVALALMLWGLSNGAAHSAAPVGDAARGAILWHDTLGCTECHGPEEDKDEPLPVASEVEDGFYDRGEGVMGIYEDITEQQMADIRAFLLGS